MTPEERKLVTELFDRLAALEDAPRDAEAERLIQDGLRQAPNGPYALVQTALVQDEALKRADARIRELEAELGIGAEPPRQGGFLESMRESIWGRRDPPRPGSVPTVRPPDAPMGAPTGYRTDAQPAGAPMMGQPPGGPMMGPPGGPMMGQPAGGAGGSFLGTAAAAAAGVIGGSLLLNSIRSMMGQGGGGAHAATSAPGGGSSPFGIGGSTESSGGLAKEAGLDQIGRGSGSRDDAGGSRGLLDSDAGKEAPTSGGQKEANYTESDAPYSESDEDFDDDFEGGDDDFGGGEDQ
jgi:hypothetical protein